MKHLTVIARGAALDAGLERITLLEKQLAPTPTNSARRRRLTAAIRVEAIAYRKSLDAAQAAATHDSAPQATVRKRTVKKSRTVQS